MQVDINALRSIERDKGIDFETVVDALEGALASAYRRAVDQDDVAARVTIDRATGQVRVFRQTIDADDHVLDEAEVHPEGFGRIVAQTARQVLMQRLREAEREMTYGEYSGKEGDLVTGVVHLHDGRVVVLDLGNAEAVLPAAEQVPGERYEHGTRLRAYITEVRRSFRGAQIVCSRSNPNLVSSLFELEVPEIADGTVVIKGIAREAGFRTKIGVASNDAQVDPVGACVGARGSRVRAIVDELDDEKIDIVPWSDEPGELVANALSPAKVTEVRLFDDERTALVVVPDYQLSLAIGREGQNARLAARLTGWRIDIIGESALAEEERALAEAYERGEVDEEGNPLVEGALPETDPTAASATPDGTATVDFDDPDVRPVDGAQEGVGGGGE